MRRTAIRLSPALSDRFEQGVAVWQRPCIETPMVVAPTLRNVDPTQRSGACPRRSRLIPL
jgi:hypothetical protein